MAAIAVRAVLCILFAVILASVADAAFVTPSVSHPKPVHGEAQAREELQDIPRVQGLQEEGYRYSGGALSSNHLNRFGKLDQRSSPANHGLKASADSFHGGILGGSDAVPNGRLAHGLLSPEVVARMARRKEGDESRNKAVSKFLHTYGEDGPMACLSFLSDPDVLPELTKAMRECTA